MSYENTGTLMPALRRAPLFRPLASRDFALLFAGMTVSLIGDGIYTVAIAWQVYQLSNTPTALSVVGIAWSVPIVLFVLLGGILSDRLDRRRIMLAAHVVRGSAVMLMGVLSVAGVLELWHVIAIVVVYAIGEAFFGPAFGAIVPDIVPASQLVQANSLNQLIEPIGLRLAGPAIGGFAIAAIGVGEAFFLDATTFAIAAVTLLLMSGQPPPGLDTGVERSARRELGEAFAFVRARPWLWGTLLSAAVGAARLRRPGGGARPLHRQERPRRRRRRSRLRVRRRRLRSRSRRPAHGTSRPAAQAHRLPLRGLDDRDVPDRRLRGGDRTLADDGRQLRRCRRCSPQG